MPLGASESHWPQNLKEYGQQTAAAAAEAAEAAVEAETAAAEAAAARTMTHLFSSTCRVHIVRPLSPPPRTPQPAGTLENNCCGSE